MTTIQCAIELKKYLEKTYECIFRGRIEVINLCGDTISLRLTLNTFYVPLYFTIQGTMEEFFAFAKEEIRVRRLNVVKYYTGYKDYKQENFDDGVYGYDWCCGMSPDVDAKQVILDENGISILTEDGNLIYIENGRNKNFTNADSSND